LWVIGPAPLNATPRPTEQTVDVGFLRVSTSRRFDMSQRFSDLNSADLPGNIGANVKHVFGRPDIRAFCSIFDGWMTSKLTKPHRILQAMHLVILAFPTAPYSQELSQSAGDISSKNSCWQTKSPLLTPAPLRFSKGARHSVLQSNVGS